jgi:flagellum-specific peptidoglycan hydrolase FlgJ
MGVKQPPANIVAAAKAAQEKWKVPCSVQLAQWIIESGWGVHSPGNNPFGMKPRSGKNDPCQMLMTTEFVHGKPTHVAQPFRRFATIADAFMAHGELLATAHVYAYAMQGLPNIDTFINRMAPRYATDPLYASKIKAMIKSQGLSQYDA